MATAAERRAVHTAAMGDTMERIKAELDRPLGRRTDFTDACAYSTAADLLRHALRVLEGLR